MNHGQLIDQFVTYAIQSGGWMEMDRLYLRNRLLAMLGLKEAHFEASTTSLKVDDIVSQFVSIARENAVISHQQQEKALIGQLYDLLTPPPSVLNALFAQRYNSDADEALEDFYRLSLRNKMIEHEENVQSYETTEGLLQTSETTEEHYDSHYYPSCDLCFDNEGYVYGEHFNAAFRYIRMNLQGKSFGFRYDSTPVWHKHCLFVAEEHQTQMQQRQTIDQCLQIVDVFPKYFVACDIDLQPKENKVPHVMYQGGCATLPIFNRMAKASFNLKHFPTMNVEILDYPLTTCRLQSKQKEPLIQLVASVIQAWRLYQDDELTAFSKEGAMQHSLNIVTRYVEHKGYEVYLIFRDSSKQAISLYQALGVTVVSNHQRKEAQTLAELLLKADPFEGQVNKIDHWMRKIDELGEF